MGKCLVSACLLGIPCRYDGKSRLCESLVEEFSCDIIVACCPEQLGGLPTPRPPAELVGGDGRAVLAGKASVIRHGTKEDVTSAFIKGAEEALALAKASGITRAILKRKSPSCGVSSHYENGKLVPGMGVTAAALHAAGIELEERD